MIEKPFQNFLLKTVLIIFLKNIAANALKKVLSSDCLLNNDKIKGVARALAFSPLDYNYGLAANDEKLAELISKIIIIKPNKADKNDKSLTTRIIIHLRGKIYEKNILNAF